MDRQQIIRYLFFIPALIFIAIFAVYPTVNTLILTLFTPEGSFNPIDNYTGVLAEREMVDPQGFAKGQFPLGALPQTFLWIGIHLPVTLSLGLMLAVVMKKVKGSTFIKSAVFLGMVIPMVVGGLMLRFIFDKDIGILNAFLEFIGAQPKGFLVYPDSALLALIFGSVWLWAGFPLILYSAGLGTIPDDYYDAAQIDGANPIQMFFKITLPLLRPVHVVVIVMTIMWDLKIFGVVYAATQGGPGGATNILALQMYFYAFSEYNFNYAAVCATLLLILTIAAAIPLIRRSVA